MIQLCLFVKSVHCLTNIFSSLSPSSYVCVGLTAAEGGVLRLPWQPDAACGGGGGRMFRIPVQVPAGQTGARG